MTHREVFARQDFPQTEEFYIKWLEAQYSSLLKYMRLCEGRIHCGDCLNTTCGAKYLMCAGYNSSKEEQ